MSDIEFSCPGCNQTLQTPVEMAGENVECPNCAQQMIVPEPSREDTSLNDISFGGEKTPQEPAREEASLEDISFGGEKTPKEPALEEASLDDISFGEEQASPAPAGEEASVDAAPAGKNKKPALSAADIIARAAAEDTGEPEAEQPKDEAPKCSECGAEMNPEAVLCMQCGYHKTMGKKISTEIE